MSKLVVHKDSGPPPSEELVRMAQKEVVVTDARGRSITLRKPPFLAQFRLVEALGPKAALNEVYFRMVLPTLTIVAIDGNPVPMPTTKLEVEALLQRLDEDGYNAVFQGIEENFGMIDPEVDKEKLKNS